MLARFAVCALLVTTACGSSDVAVAGEEPGAGKQEEGGDHIKAHADRIDKMSGGDGLITVAELQGYMYTMFKSHSARAIGHEEGTKQSFAMEDRDGDGSVTRAEMLETRVEHYGVEIEGKTTLPREELVELGAEFEAMDADGDGKASEKEFVAYHEFLGDAKRVVAAADKDGDGKASLAELKAMPKGAMPPSVVRLLADVGINALHEHEEL